jgi:hypothetical protein
MKLLTYSLLCLGLLSAQVMAQSPLELAGFTVKTNDSKLMKLEFNEKTEFIISKKKFKDSKSAQRFCKNQNSSLDTDLSILLLSMAGAVSADKFIEDSFRYNFINKGEEFNGLWTWDIEGGVTLLPDNELEEVKVSFNELRQIKKVQIAALCVKKI